MSGSNKYQTSEELMDFRGRQQYVVGVEVNGMFIYDPFISECGRFTADPVADYGMTLDEANALIKHNDLIDQATQQALNAGCLTIQQQLDVESGDAAGMFFSGDRAGNLGKEFSAYLAYELNLRADQEQDTQRAYMPSP